MFKNNRKFNKFNSGSGNTFNTRRFSNGFSNRRKIKRLDHNLFIKKADDFELEENNQIFSNIKFADFQISDLLKKNIKDHGYEIPTEIQAKTIPEILSGRDVIAMADTGTGKTAAFLISLINKSCLNRNQKVLIIVPTRELAVQIRDEFRIFAKETNLRVVALVGGVDINQQMNILRHNPNFVIATPGRLRDLVERREINLGQFQNVVLDEVDKMVDIGFINEIKYFISLLPKNRQSLFFSATVNNKTEDILKNFVTNPITISVKKQVKINNIEQDIVRLNNGKSKIDTLHDLLVKPEFEKVIVFGRTKRGIQKLTNELIDRGHKAVAIHGNKSQGQRQRALQQFKNNEIQILTATDVVSRGIDIDFVTHVINYDAPESYDDYIHRIGRTGRAGRKGVALTFVD